MAILPNNSGAIYKGSQDRRVHRVFVTRNTEYHTRKGICVGVRDRHTGDWVKSHLALSTRVSGGLRFHIGGGILPNPGEPTVGDSLLFEAAGRDLVTSTIVAIKRPPLDVAKSYPA